VRGPGDRDEMSEYNPDQHFEAEEYQEEINPWEIIGLLLKHRWEIALIVALSVLAGFLWNLYATEIYSAKSSVVIKFNQPYNVMKDKETVIPDRIQFFDFHTKLNMITSEPLAVDLVKRLIDRGYFRNRLEKSNFDEMSPEEKENLIRSIAKGIARSVKVKNPEKTNLAIISFESPNPNLARDVVNILAEIAVEYNRNEQLLMSRDSAIILDEQLEDSRKRLEEAEAKLYSYRIKNDIFEVHLDQQAIQTRRSDLLRRLTDLSDQRRQMESSIEEISKIMERKDFTKYTPVVSNMTLHNLNERLVGAEVEYRELLLTYGHKHPQVEKVANKISILRNKFEQELTKSKTKLEFQLSVIKSRLSVQEDLLAKLEESAVYGTEKDIDYVILEREANAARNHYRSMLAAVKEVSVNSSNLMNNLIYIHEKAITPTHPIKPRKSLNLMIALFFGVTLGLGFAVARELLDQTIQSPEDVKKVSNLDVLSTVPLFSRRNEESGEAHPLLVVNRPKSLFAESITSLRTHLNIRLPQERPLALLVTSSAPREGKSLISANLALSMAQDGKKTLLLDADLHRPSLHKFFTDTRSEGLFDCIVQALNPMWSDIDPSELSFGDIHHLIKLKQWTGTLRIQWDSLPRPLTISYREGAPSGSNIESWRTEYIKPSGFPPPQTPRFELDESELEDLDTPGETGKTAHEFIKQYPRLIRSHYFSRHVSETYIINTEHKNLHMMTAGSNPKNPSEILGSEQMRILLQLLKERYDRIIIDTPPAWPLSDVGIMAPLADGVLWICRAGEIPKKVFQRSLHHVQTVQPVVLGVVINAIDVHGDKYYGYSSYYRYYRYSYYHYYSNYMDDEEKKDTPAPQKPLQLGM